MFLDFIDSSQNNAKHCKKLSLVLQGYINVQLNMAAQLLGNYVARYLGKYTLNECDIEQVVSF